MEQAIFAAGCFWGVEPQFQNLAGVHNTRVGYTGGTTSEPSYKDVCRGDTGHAEAVRVDFDPKEIDYETLVDIFFKIHDPTQKDRQGPDVGRQYRSAIFAVNDKQREIAEKKIAELEERTFGSGRVATEVEAAGPFYEAEEYHQNYHKKRRGDA